MNICNMSVMHYTQNWPEFPTHDRWKHANRQLNTAAEPRCFGFVYSGHAVLACDTSKGTRIASRSHIVLINNSTDQVCGPVCSQQVANIHALMDLLRNVKIKHMVSRYESISSRTRVIKGGKISKQGSDKAKAVT